MKIFKKIKLIIKNLNKKLYKTHQLKMANRKYQLELMGINKMKTIMQIRMNKPNNINKISIKKNWKSKKSNI